ncbi:MAG: sugar phosphate isomerase/epimerase [Verrucomicrobiia bacterium]
MKRFLWLAMGMMMACAATAKADEACAAADKLGWQLAIHSYTFKEFPIFDAIDKTASLGLKYMSISGSVNLGGPKPVKTMTAPPKDVEAIQKKLAACGIKKLVNMGVVKPVADEAETRAIFEFAKKMGIDVLVAEMEPDALDTVEKLCKEFNMKVAIHNHPKRAKDPKYKLWDPEYVLSLVKGRDSRIGVCADTGHWVRSGLDPVECLKKLEGRIIALHFKDLNEKNNPKAHDVPWGTGVGNAKGQLAELKRQGFRGAFCIEYEHNWKESLPEIAQCVKFFNAACAELAGK